MHMYNLIMDQSEDSKTPTILHSISSNGYYKGRDVDVEELIKILDSMDELPYTLINSDDDFWVFAVKDGVETLMVGISDSPDDVEVRTADIRTVGRCMILNHRDKLHIVRYNTHTDMMLGSLLGATDLLIQ